MKNTNKALPLTITLGSILLVFCLALTTLWNIVLIYNTLQLKAYAGPHLKSIWSQWVILGVGSLLFVIIITGIILFIVFMSRQIILNQLQKNFIDSVTHELKTPLTSLRLYVETLQRHRVEPEKQTWLLETMLKDIEHLDLLVSHVLEAVRIEYRRDPERLDTVDLNLLLQECKETLTRRYSLPETAIQIAGQAQPLRSDLVGLRLVFMNLLDNAIKYSPEHPLIQIQIGPENGTFLPVSIADQGLGIPETEIKKIFRRFYRVSGHEATKGNGLGLFIVAETLRQLKGKIQVSSSCVSSHLSGQVNSPIRHSVNNPVKKQGSTFTVSLPL
ncbi:MAG: HAMP domain-containing histidine kinase [Candidatus Sericytochromatia bacterium]|nr:HAMP domain-containing histidine kinase [Candidatus Sericytochromatia bacterium]